MRLIGLAGWSGSGKTTLLAKLLPALIARGRTRLDVEARAPRLRRRSAGQGFAYASAGRRARGADLERAALGVDARAARARPSRRWRELVPHLSPRRSRHRRRFQGGEPRKLEVHRSAVGKPLLLPERSEHRCDRERSPADECAAAVRRSERHRSDRRSRRRARAAISAMSAPSELRRRPRACGRSLRSLRRRKGRRAARRPAAARVGRASGCVRVCAIVAINVRPGTEAEAVAKAAGLPTLYDAPGDASGPARRREGRFDLGR